MEPIMPFSRQLTHTLKACGYTGDDQDVNARADFLMDKYKKAAVPITKTTLKSWFAGDSRPLFESRSRQRMHELCFVLGFDYDQVRDFFNKIYLSRSFNCRSIQEAVYCYCFSKGETYTHASLLIEEAEKILAAKTDGDDGAPILFTNAMEEEIRLLTSDRQFLDYVDHNQKSFCEYNQTIKRELNRMINQIRGSSQDQELVALHRKTGAGFTGSEFEKLQGLAVKEYFLYHNNCQDIKGSHITSSDFMLSQILGIHLPKYYGSQSKDQSFSKNARLCHLARINFPSKQTLSDILNGKKATSFDAVRKMFILLHFYAYFVHDDVMKDQSSGFFADYSSYVEDASDLLACCNYGPLYEENPYDMIFLYSAGTVRPLDTFREIIGDAVEEDE